MVRFVLIFIYVAAFLTESASAESGIFFAKYEGGRMSPVLVDHLESQCGGDFAFRVVADDKRDLIPNYLEPEYIKASFSGRKIHERLDSAIDEAKSYGSCIWYFESEKQQVGN